MQLPDQACGHSCAPISHGVAARNTSLDPINTHPGNLYTKLGRNNLGNIGKLGRVGGLLVYTDQGGAPAFTSLGSKPPLLEHFALGEGKAKEV